MTPAELQRETLKTTCQYDNVYVILFLRDEISIENYKL